MNKYKVKAEVDIDFDIYEKSNVYVDGGDLEDISDFSPMEVMAEVDGELEELTKKFSYAADVYLEVEAEDEKQAEEKVRQLILNEIEWPTIRIYSVEIRANVSIYSVEVNKL